MALNTKEIKIFQIEIQYSMIAYIKNESDEVLKTKVAEILNQIRPKSDTVFSIQRERGAKLSLLLSEYYSLKLKKVDEDNNRNHECLLEASHSLYWATLFSYTQILSEDHTELRRIYKVVNKDYSYIRAILRSMHALSGLYNKYMLSIKRNNDRIN